MDAGSPGATMVELLVLMAVMGVLCTIGTVSVARTLDRVAVLTARDGLAAHVAEARALALARGSALVVVDPTTSSSRIESPEGVSAGRSLHLVRGTRLTIDGRSDPVMLEFDGRGVGVLAGRTFRIRRNGAEARLTLSSYGRPRRW